MFVKDIMSFPVITANENDTLREVAIKMLENKIGALPVVDQEGNLVGFLSETDFSAKEHNIPFSRTLEPKLFGRWMTKQGIEKMYEDAKNSPHSFADYAAQFYQMCATQREVLLSMIDILFQVSTANGVLEKEQEILATRHDRRFNPGRIGARGDYNKQYRALV